MAFHGPRPADVRAAEEFTARRLRESAARKPVGSIRFRPGATERQEEGESEGEEASIVAPLSLLGSGPSVVIAREEPSFPRGFRRPTSIDALPVCDCLVN